jgi:hypothetical protein
VMISRATIFATLVAVALGLAWRYDGKKTEFASNDAPLGKVSLEQPSSASLKPVLQTLPLQIERDKLEPASRDPFSLVIQVMASTPQKQVTKTVTIAAPTPMPAPVIAMPVPTPPQLNLRFTGRMTTPDGQQLIFATLAETPITLSVGQTLSNGYKVDGITDKSVQLSYPPLGTTAQLVLPEPPKYEIR